MTAILFVCMGNICRSPLAEGVFRHRAQEAGALERFEIDSAGTGGWHAGAPADPRMQAVAQRRGVALESLARQVVPQDFDRFDLIVCADESNRRDLLAMGADPSRTVLLLACDPDATVREVPDPYYGEADGFETVFDLVDGACAALLDGLLESPAKLPTPHD